MKPSKPTKCQKCGEKLDVVNFGYGKALRCKKCRYIIEPYSEATALYYNGKRSGEYTGD